MMAISPSYVKHYSEFSKRFSARQSILELMESKKTKWGLTATHHYVSLGCGDGEYDKDIISRCMPELEIYEGVDVNPDGLKQLKDIHELLNKYQVVTHCEKCEDWSGPSQPPNVISLIHVLYYVADIPDILNQCLTWLNPGGCIVINMCGSNGFNHAFNKESQQRCIPSEIQAWLHQSKIEQFEECVLPGTFDMRGAEQITLNMFALKETDHIDVCEVEKFAAQMESLYGDISGLPAHEVIWIVWKPTSK